MVLSWSGCGTQDVRFNDAHVFQFEYTSSASFASDQMKFGNLVQWKQVQSTLFTFLGSGRINIGETYLSHYSDSIAVELVMSRPY